MRLCILILRLAFLLFPEPVLYPLRVGDSPPEQTLLCNSSLPTPCGPSPTPSHVQKEAASETWCFQKPVPSVCRRHGVRHARPGGPLLCEAAQLDPREDVLQANQDTVCAQAGCCAEVCQSASTFARWIINCSVLRWMMLFFRSCRWLHWRGIDSGTGFAIVWCSGGGPAYGGVQILSCD